MIYVAKKKNLEYVCLPLGYVIILFGGTLVSYEQFVVTEGDRVHPNSDGRRRCVYPLYTERMFSDMFWYAKRDGCEKEEKWTIEKTIGVLEKDHNIISQDFALVLREMRNRLESKGLALLCCAKVHATCQDPWVNELISEIYEDTVKLVRC